ncbi:patatin-like phospholipase family protein [Pelagibacterium luteolum]|uniref:NTE family protein n=1 Tax=Pelagibacterium luteolum TaxID=440168 RepID=A0A1G7YIT2_9HYPH|nr:patatin-like phospholipase family protein [Pelagibacterium luteolum]SDG96317.1 NTE family protein [Pelagibacterium luteolum]
MKQIKVGLALGSGAARGWSHIGVLEALLDAGIVPDIVCGTSMGALVGGAYASGRLAELKAWAVTADRKVVTSMIDVSLLAGGLVDGMRIVKWLGDLEVSRDIETLGVPFGAVATDLTTGREVWLQSGALDKAIRASIALPGIFSPTEIEGRWLVDGGLVNPVPVSLCRAMGADFIIAVNLNEDLLGRRLTRTEDTSNQASSAKGSNLLDAIISMPASLRAQASGFKLFGTSGTTPGYFDVLANAINIMQDHITRSRLAGEPPHVQILPRVIDMGLMDFHRAEAAIAEGGRATETALPNIKAKLVHVAEHSG